MGKPFIVVGDTTSHGGRVISGDFTTDVNGKAVARVGDMTVCPRCKGTFRIKTGADDSTFMGLALARHGDITDCGAMLISSQTLVDWSNESSMGQSAAGEETAPTPSSAIANPTKSGICLECMLKAAAAGSSTVSRG